MEIVFTLDYIDYSDFTTPYAFTIVFFLQNVVSHCSSTKKWWKTSVKTM